jgi:hypothetical protein
LKRIDELSLGWRTELIFPAFDGLIEERSDSRWRPTKATRSR